MNYSTRQEFTQQDYIDSAIRKMGKNCVVCKKYDCDYSSSEKIRSKWCQEAFEIYADEYFDCFIGISFSIILHNYEII